MVEQTISVESIVSRIDELTADLLIQDDVGEARLRWAESMFNLAQFAADASIGSVAALAESGAQAMRDSRAVCDADAPEALEQSLAAIRAALSTGISQAAPISNTSSIADDPELIGDFVQESREHLHTIETQLLALEQDAGNTEAVHAIFRSFHTIKGLAGFLEFQYIQEVAHEVETILDEARQGKLRLTSAAFDIILESRDYIGSWLRFLDGPRTSPVPPALQSNMALLGRIRSIPAPSAEQTSEPATEAATEQPPNGPESRPPQSIRESARSVKVETSKLDYLVDMVGEMVIAQSMLRHDPAMANAGSTSLNRNLGQLVRITDEVQRTAMSMRMVPIGPLFQKMARLVRDLSRKCGKKIQFESDGENVEMDRNIVEELADPLMHMIRNAVDHGIESPEQRAQSRKREAATVSLKAFHRSGQICIQIADDGRGIDRDRVLAKARSKGMVGANATLTDAECLSLIFQPGFSTAEQVSDVSGRGVGMDVVKKQIQKLRGSVDIESHVGAGTTFTLRLPLTLAIIDGLVVAVGSERYIIPLASVKEMLRPTADMVSTVENRAEVVAIRNQLLPLLRLHQRFSTAPRSTDPTECVLIVTDLDGLSFCLMVDELIGKQEVVIKNLGPLFANTSGLAGGAILGDGHVGLILDLATLFGGRTDA